MPPQICGEAARYAARVAVSCDERARPGDKARYSIRLRKSHAATVNVTAAMTTIGKVWRRT